MNSVNKKSDKKILTMNLGVDKASAVKNICQAIGAEYEELSTDCGGVTVEDVIAHGTSGLKQMADKDGECSLTMELAIFAGLSGKELDIFLDRYKKTGLTPIPLKSVVTDTNRSWTVRQLYSELVREHLFYQMSRRR